MRKVLLLSAAAAAAASMTAPASAAVVAEFIQGTPVSSLSGFNVINTFDNTNGISGTGFGVQSNSNGNGAIIPLADSSGTSYLTVVSGGSATIDLGGVSGFAFEWGSLDTYNKLTVELTNGTFLNYVPGTDFTNTYANGNQLVPETNGTFKVLSTGAERFKSIKLSSTGNSFEIDNLAVQAVPEPATWAMMIVGMGGIGASMRRRRTAVRFA